METPQFGVRINVVDVTLGGFAGWEEITSHLIEVHVADNLAIPTSGTQYIEIDTDTSGAPQGDQIQQTITTVPGQQYILSFDLRDRKDVNPDPGVLVHWDGAIIGTFNANTDDDDLTDWAHFDIPLTASSSSTVLGFQDDGPDNGLSALIDTVSLTVANGWVGGPTGVWSDLNNWSNGVPTGSDDIIIDGNVIVTLDTSFTLTTGTLTIQNGSELIIDTGGSLTNESTNTITVDGLLTINSGQTLTNTATGTIQVTSNGTVNNAGTLTNSGTITNHGTINNNAGGLIFTSILSAPGITNNHGTLNNDGIFDVAEGTLTNNVGGTINNNAGGLIFTNSGTVNNAGTLTNSGTITNHGTLNNSGTINNTFAIDNFNTLNNSGTINNSNTITNNGTITNSGTINNDGTLQNSNILINDNIITNDGTIANAGTFTNNRIFTNNNLIFNNVSIINNDIINNFGTINNNVSITNPGTIKMYCDAVYTGAAPTPNPLTPIACANVFLVGAQIYWSDAAGNKNTASEPFFQSSTNSGTSHAGLGIDKIIPADDLDPETSTISIPLQDGDNVFNYNAFFDRAILD